MTVKSTWLYDLLENEESKSTKKIVFDFSLGIIILTSIVLIFLENKKGQLPPDLEKLDHVINGFFILEFILRFYVSTNFLKDVRSHNLLFAIKRKWKWFMQFSTIIDFLAILPSLNFFRIFRTLRFLRILRIFKAYRTIKAFKEIDKVFTVLKGMKEENRVFYVFFGFTIFFILLISFAMYISESGASDSELGSFYNSIWYSLKVIGLADDTPQTGMGKFFATILQLANMAIFGFLISIILNKIQNIMTAITSGKLGKLTLEDHIVICGYTKSSINVIEDLLTDKNNINNIVLITQKKLEDDMSGIIYINADFTEMKSLHDANIAKAKFAIVFAESKPHDTIKDVDLRTAMTIFNIEKEASEVHTIAEINDINNAEIIKDKIDGDEILYKEFIDSRIISTCINHKHMSNMFYEMFGSSKSDRLAETNLSAIGLKKEATVKTVKQYFLEDDATFLGFIDSENKSYLSPKNTISLDDSMRLIYLKG